MNHRAASFTIKGSLNSLLKCYWGRRIVYRSRWVNRQKKKLCCNFE